MNDYMSKLTLERGVAYRRRWKRGAVELGGLQWTMDGNPLALTLQEARSSRPKEGRRITADLYYSVLQSRRDSDGDAGREALRVLLGEDEWEEFPGRVPLLIGQCLHVECAVISAVIERRGDAVTWGSFRPTNLVRTCTGPFFHQPSHTRSIASNTTSFYVRPKPGPKSANSAHEGLLMKVGGEGWLGCWLCPWIGRPVRISHLKLRPAKSAECCIKVFP